MRIDGVQGLLEQVETQDRVFVRVDCDGRAAEEADADAVEEGLCQAEGEVDEGEGDEDVCGG